MTREMAIFLTALLVIISAASVDTYLNIKYPIIAIEEENPLARWILFLSDNDIALLISLKFLGTTLAIIILFFIYLHSKFLAVMIASGTAITMLGLIIYMVVS
jgi:hypothetical protein